LALRATVPGGLRLDGEDIGIKACPWALEGVDVDPWTVGAPDRTIGLEAIRILLGFDAIDRVDRLGRQGVIAVD
jgi:hypothetical protein